MSQSWKDFQENTVSYLTTVNVIKLYNYTQRARTNIHIREQTTQTAIFYDGQNNPYNDSYKKIHTT